METTLDAERLLTDAEASEFLGVTKSTLATWRCRRTHKLPYVKIGRSVRYRLRDLQTWIDSRTVK